MESDDRSGDTGSAPELVARVIRDLVERTDYERNLLLSDLLCAAWPTHRCQDQ
jgi:hypothetical protein